MEPGLLGCSPDDRQRRELWQSLSRLVDSGLPICFIGDFNVLLDSSEKRGGPFHESAEVIELRQFLLDNSLLDLGFMALKLDMERAYDLMRWDFIGAVMTNFGFSKKFVDLVMDCIINPSFAILVNDQVTNAVVQIYYGIEARRSTVAVPIHSWCSSTDEANPP